MKVELYEDIITSIRNFRGLSKDCIKMLIEKYSNVSQHTLYSIIALEVTQKMKVRHRELFGGDKNYYLRYLQAVKAGESFGILLRLSQELDAAPALLARSVLDKYCEATMPNVPRSEISKLLKDTTLIEDGQLSLEIYACILNDDQYGSISDTFGNSIGVQYEYKLQSIMIEKNLAFHDEEYLRSRGYDKTPDFKLEIPIMEEEELWISGEELYTEGSSDEEESKFRRRPRNKSKVRTASSSPGGRENLRGKAAASEETDKTGGDIAKKSTYDNQSESTQSTERIDDTGTPSISETLDMEEKSNCDENSVAVSEDNCENDSEISWEAKRGSIKLPTVEGSNSSQSNTS